MTTVTKPESKAPSQEVDLKASPATVSANPLVGTWTNTNTATRDLVKIVIAATHTGISVHAYGACVPTPCDWGAVAALDYASSVSSTAAVAFSAQYTFSFSKVILTGHLDGKLLTVESFTEFTDGSGRNNYYSAMQMKK
jgi:hypothetical protein